jgi:transcriptional regulator of heat shock response
MLVITYNLVAFEYEEIKMTETEEIMMIRGKYLTLQAEITTDTKSLVDFKSKLTEVLRTVGLHVNRAGSFDDLREVEQILKFTEQVQYWADSMADCLEKMIPIMQESDRLKPLTGLFNES